MNNYIFGKYNNFTKELKQIIDKTEQRDKSRIVIKTDEHDKKEIIKQAEQGNIPNEEAKRIYLDYLKKTQKFSFKKISSYFNNLWEDFKFSLDRVDDWFCETNMWPFNRCYDGFIELFFESILCSILIFLIITCICVIIEGIGISFEKCYKYLLLTFVPQTTYLVPAIKLIETQIKKRFSRIIDVINNKKIISHKIEQLTNELKYGPKEISDKFDEILPQPIKEKKNPLEDNILQELSKLVDKLEYINLEQRKILLDKVKAISNEYIEKLKKINFDNSKVGLFLENDSYLKLISDILGKIAILEEEIYQIINKNIEINAIDCQYEILTRQIENCYTNEDKVIGGDRSQKVRKLHYNK